MRFSIIPLMPMVGTGLCTHLRVCMLFPVTHALLTSCSKDSFVMSKEKFDIIYLDVTLYTERAAAGQQDAE
jgi:hypothetical protein